MQWQWLEAGKIVGTHGVRGEVKVEPWADGPSFLLDFDRVKIDGTEYAVEQARVHKQQVLLKLAGVDTVEAAAALRGRVLRIDRSQARLDESAVFIADLIGLPVFAGGEEIGRIAEVLTLPANDVYVVRGAHEYLIPVVREYVLHVDPQAGVTVRLVEGMQADAD